MVAKDFGAGFFPTSATFSHGNPYCHCGDGSGTATGGTDHEIGIPNLNPSDTITPGQMWMGT